MPDADAPYLALLAHLQRHPARRPAGPSMKEPHMTTPSVLDTLPATPPWLVKLSLVRGETRYQFEGHTHPALTHDASYWAAGEEPPTDGDGRFLYDGRADICPERVRLGWMLAATPAMHDALRGLLAADTSLKARAAREQALDALALAAVPVEMPEPPGGWRKLLGFSVTPAGGGDGVAADTLSQAAAILVEGGVRRGVIWALAAGSDGEVETNWDPLRGEWSPWRPVEDGPARSDLTADLAALYAAGNQERQEQELALAAAEQARLDRVADLRRAIAAGLTAAGVGFTARMSEYLALPPDCDPHQLYLAAEARVRLDLPEHLAVGFTVHRTAEGWGLLSGRTFPFAVRDAAPGPRVQVAEYPTLAQAVAAARAGYLANQREGR